MTRRIVINQPLADQLAAEKIAAVPQRYAGVFESEPLCAWQRKVAARGIVEAELVRSNYGWSVRYASGLQGFGLIASARAKQVDGTYEGALAFAKGWAAADPTRRFVSVSA